MDIRREKSPGNTRSVGRTDTRRTTHRHPRKGKEPPHEKAAANLLVTFQPTGLKLKLLNALFHGGHCIVNSKMLFGTGLDKACLIADTPQAMARAVETALNEPFDQAKRTERIQLLKAYDNEKNIHVLSDLLEEKLR